MWEHPPHFDKGRGIQEGFGNETVSYSFGLGKTNITSKVLIKWNMHSANKLGAVVDRSTITYPVSPSPCRNITCKREKIVTKSDGVTGLPTAQRSSTIS